MPVQETQEMQVQSLGREDPLEKGMATHCSVLAWRIPWPEEPGRLQSWGARGAWRATVHGGPEEPGGLQSMGGQRSLAGYSPWGHKGRTLLRTHTQQQVTACTKSKNNHERETEIWELRLDQYFSSFLREFSLILMTSLSSVDRKAFGILISTINFILMSNYHSISSHHTGQKQCSCS